MHQEPPKRFDQELVFAPLSWLLLVLARCWLYGFSPLHRFFSYFASWYSRTVESGSKMVQKSFCSFQYQTFCQIRILY